MSELSFRKYFQNYNKYTPNPNIQISPYHLNQNNLPTYKVVQPSNHSIYPLHHPIQSLSHICYIHQDKKAYYLANRLGQNIQLCKKCAVQFASQGIQVSKLLNDQIQYHQKELIIKNYMRRIQLDLFLTRLKLLKDKYIKKKQTITSTLESYHQYFSHYHNFYSSLQNKVNQLWVEIQNQHSRNIQVNLIWRKNTNQSIIIIQKVIQQLLENLTFSQNPQPSQMSSSFYKNILIFYEYQCKQLISQFDQHNDCHLKTLIESFHDDLTLQSLLDSLPENQSLHK